MSTKKLSDLLIKALEWVGSNFIAVLITVIMLIELTYLCILLGPAGYCFFLLGISFMIATDYRQMKNPFDKKKLPFSAYEDWWRWRYDDCIIWVIGGGIGAGVSNEIAIPIAMKYLEWPELAEASLDSTAIVVSTVMGAKILNWLINKK